MIKSDPAQRRDEKDEGEQGFAISHDDTSVFRFGGIIFLASTLKVHVRLVNGG